MPSFIRCLFFCALLLSPVWADVTSDIEARATEMGLAFGRLDSEASFRYTTPDYKFTYSLNPDQSASREECVEMVKDIAMMLEVAGKPKPPSETTARVVSLEEQDERTVKVFIELVNRSTNPDGTIKSATEKRTEIWIKTDQGWMLQKSRIVED